jgi:Protein of unknown function (DUF1559)
MNITVTCVSCGQKLSAPASLAGRRVPCPKCKAPVDVPAAAPVTLAAPPVFTPQVVPEIGPRAPASTPSVAAAGKNPLPPTQASVWDDLLPATPVAAQAGTGQIDLGLGEPLLPRKPRGSIGRSNKTLVPMIAVVALLFLVGGGFGAWMMLSSRGAAADDFFYVPNDADLVLAGDVNGIISSKVVNTSMPEAVATMKMQLKGQSNWAAEDFGRFAGGARLQGLKWTGVMRLNRRVTDADLNEPGSTVETSGQYRFVIVRGTAACRLDSYTVAMGEPGELRAVLERNSPAKLADEMQAAVKEVDFTKTFVAAASLKKLAAAAASGSLPGVTMPTIPGVSDSVRAAAVQADFGNDLAVKASVICKDAASAEQMKAMVDGFLAVARFNSGKAPPAASKLLKSLEISSSAATLHGSVTIDAETMLELQRASREGTGLGAAVGGGSPPQQAPPTFSGIPQPVNANPARPFGQGVNARPGRPGGGFNSPARGPAAFQREPASNNLHQIALALLEYEAKEGHFPPAASYDAQGKPLLSWRVAILPYLKQEQLYKRFHLDEPWDSQNNKRLLPQMPFVYRSPFGKVVGFNKTAMLAPIGQSAAFFGQQGRKPADFTDGTSNTILIVEAAPERAVEWTRPDDLRIDEANPTNGLFGQRDGGFLAAFADGPVKFIPQSTNKDVLRALFTINGGESIPPDLDTKP